MLLGDYYLSEEDKEKALNFYKKGIENDLDNYGLLKNTILLQLEVEKYEDAILLSNKGLEIFPAQPLLYLVNGVANNELKNADQAIEIFEMGLDYLFDDPKMEYDFYQQLIIAHTLKGSLKKAKMYQKKKTNYLFPIKRWMIKICKVKIKLSIILFISFIHYLLWGW